MKEFKLECKPFKLRTGEWMPEVHLLEYYSGKFHTTKLMAPEEIKFNTEVEAHDYSESMAHKWLKDKYL